MVSSESNKIREMTILGVLIAIVAISTRIGFNVTGTPGGYAHFGNIPLIAVAILLGKRRGAIVGGMGMFIFDLVSEYFAWAPFTLIIRAAMGFIIGAWAWYNGKQGQSLILNIIGVLLASVVMVGGYFISEYLIYGTWVGPVQSLPGNIIQAVVGIAGGLPLAYALRNSKMIRKYLSLE